AGNAQPEGCAATRRSSVRLDRHRGLRDDGGRVDAEARFLWHRDRRMDGDRCHRRRRQGEIQGQAAQDGMKNGLLLAAVIATALIAACAPQPPAGLAAKAAPAEFPEAYYLQAAAAGKPVFRIDPSRSLVVVEVRRGGSLSRFGHDHVVASHEMAGY